MTTDHDDTEIRRYLLGELADEPAAALERDYFAHDELFDRVWAAENDLVEEYVAGRLSAHELDRFERHYLTSPEHRDRVAMARQLRSREPRGLPIVWTVALAAALILAVGAVWIVRSWSRAQPPSAAQAGDSPRPVQPPPPATTAPPARTPVTIAVVLSAITVRGTDDAASVTVPQGTDLVVLRLEGDRTAPRFDRGRGVVRRLSGNEVWSGPAVADDGTPPLLARVDVPADRLTPDDYIVVLVDTTASGAEIERYRYFLRVRSR